MPNFVPNNDGYTRIHEFTSLNFTSSQEGSWDPDAHIAGLMSRSWERTCEEALYAGHAPLINNALARFISAEVRDNVANVVGNPQGVMYSQVIGWRTSPEIEHYNGEDHPKSMSVLCIAQTRDGRFCFRSRGKMGDWHHSLLEMPGGFFRTSDQDPTKALVNRFQEDYNDPNFFPGFQWFGMMESPRIGECVSLAYAILPEGYIPPDSIYIHPDDLGKNKAVIALPSFAIVKFFLEGGLDYVGY